MKTNFKILSFIIFFLTINFQTFAQSSSGIKAGANYTFYKNLNEVEYSLMPGFQLGYTWNTNIFNPNYAIGLNFLL